MADNEALKKASEKSEGFMQYVVNPITVKDGKLGWENSDGTFSLLESTVNEICKTKGFCELDGNENNSCDVIDCPVAVLNATIWSCYERYQILKKAIKDAIDEVVE